jgi:hypothetical protein
MFSIIHLKVILHQFWVKTIFHWNYMKQTDSSIIIVRNCACLPQHPWLFIFSSRGHDRQSSDQNISSRGTFTKLFMQTSANPCAFLSSSPLLWRLINFRLFCSDDMKQTDSSIIIVRNVCVLTSASMIVYLFFTRSRSAIIGPKLFFTRSWEYTFIFFSSTQHCAWAIISRKEFKSWVTRISFALLYRKTELSAVKYFAICS